jgi:hypothetical protein
VQLSAKSSLSSARQKALGKGPNSGSELSRGNIFIANFYFEITSLNF